MDCELCWHPLVAGEQQKEDGSHTQCLFPERWLATHRVIPMVRSECLNINILEDRCWHGMRSGIATTQKGALHADAPSGTQGGPREDHTGVSI